MFDLDFIFGVARQAGKAILEVYGTDFEVNRKVDKSPVTLADLRSHQIISDSLKSRYPDIPVLSEEGKEIPFEIRRNWSRFWVVDPLDGTKEFVKRNGEFAVNIALVENNTPVIGIIHIPVNGDIFVGDVREGCWKLSGSERNRIKVADMPTSSSPVRILRSRSHPSPELNVLLSAIASYEIENRGSAIKFCDMAEGKADFYPRFGPTWEWDTAAGQAIVTAAGGIMLDSSGKPFSYNKQNLLNGPFMVASSIELLIKTGILEAALLLHSEKSSG